MNPLDSESFMKRKLFIFTFILLIAGFEFVQIMTYQFKTLMKNDLFGSKECNLPCWNNITPGETSSKDGLSLLQRINYIDSRSKKMLGSIEKGTCRWSWTISGNRIEPYMNWNENLVSEITMGLPYRLTIQEILDHYGNPTAIGLNEGGNPEKWYWMVILYYPEKGFDFSTYTEVFSTIIMPTSEVGNVSIHKPTTLFEYIDIKYPNIQKDKIDWIKMEWKGYGNLEEMYDLSDLKQY